MPNTPSANGSLCPLGRQHSAEIAALKEGVVRVEGACLNVVNRVGDLEVKQALSWRQLFLLGLICLFGALAGNGGGHALIQLLAK